MSITQVFIAPPLPRSRMRATSRGFLRCVRCSCHGLRSHPPFGLADVASAARAAEQLSRRRSPGVLAQYWTASGSCRAAAMVLRSSLGSGAMPSKPVRATKSISICRNASGSHRSRHHLPGQSDRLRPPDPEIPFDAPRPCQVLSARCGR